MALTTSQILDALNVDVTQVDSVSRNATSITITYLDGHKVTFSLTTEGATA